MTYTNTTYQLYPGSYLFMYTDGVTEATDAENNLYGTARLVDALNAKEPTDSKSICKYVREDIDRFVGDTEQFDDITMLCIKYNGA